MGKNKDKEKECSICGKIIKNKEAYILVDQQEILCYFCFKLKYVNNEVEH